MYIRLSVVGNALQKWICDFEHSTATCFLKVFVDIITVTIFQRVRHQYKYPEGESCWRSEEMAVEYAGSLLPLEFKNGNI